MQFSVINFTFGNPAQNKGKMKLLTAQLGVVALLQLIDSDNNHSSRFHTAMQTQVDFSCTKVPSAAWSTPNLLTLYKITW